MYSMKQTCELTGMNYETLKYYCNEELILNVQRDKNNRRIFSDNDIAWINSLACLKKCGMSIKEMKEYLALCLLGQSTIPQRKIILERKRNALLMSIDELQKSVDYIDWKQSFYDDVLSGKIVDNSHLHQVDE